MRNRVLSVVLCLVLIIALTGLVYLQSSRVNILQLEIEQLKAQSAELSDKLSSAEDQLADAQERLIASYIAPYVSVSSQKVKQGEIIAVHVYMNSEHDEPTISTELGDCIFIPLENNSYVSYVPVWYAQDPGKYDIKVNMGAESETVSIEVRAASYGEQHMTMSSATAGSTIGADNANEDYNQKIGATYAIADSEKYWEDPFIQPVEGRISTEFGLYRYTTYTEGGSRTTRHTGIDIAVPQGTPVPASNSGRVVFAGEVIITGNTVVIEHGGGLKTYYFHLSKLCCEAGDKLKQGDLIGEVGTTGYSTGPHLHFEVKIGNKSLNPWDLFNGTSGLYK